MDFDLAQLRALEAAVEHGTFEAAARALHVTPSAVSQRLRALEVQTGRVLLVRSKPIRPTAAGETVLRLARQVALLASETSSALGDGDAVDERPPTLVVAVNADSLATWVLPALAPLATETCFHLRREDEGRTSDLLRSGEVIAAISSDADPVPGCVVRPLGSMRYAPVATQEFVHRRSEERRVGKECRRLCRSRWSPYH
jgi:LysR family transcriptional regulator (chromosome initiation inhibitor)